jgi:hypothetical protein
MSLDLAKYEIKAREAVKFFWNTRDDARQRQSVSKNMDHGERFAVRAGKHMDVFFNVVL